MMWKSFLTKTTVIVCAAFAASNVAVAQQSERPFFMAKGRTIAAFFEGEKCAETVRTLFKGRNPSVFQDGNPAAGRLMNAVSSLIKQQCDQVQRVTAKGQVDGKTMYNGIAEAATNWLIVELGASKNSNFLGSRIVDKNNPPEQLVFKERNDFLTYANMQADLGNKSVLCGGYDQSSNSCTSATTLINPNSKGSTVRITSQIKGGAIAAIEFLGSAENGFLCSNTSDATVSITGGTLTDDGRAEMSVMFTDRWLEYGDRVCVGYVGEADSLKTVSFDENGYQTTSLIDLTSFDSAPKLRLEK